MTSLTEAFRCPSCGAALDTEGGAGGALICAHAHRFPVIDGVPRFVEEAAYAESFGVQWNRWNRTQVDSANGTTIFRDRFERYFGDPTSLKGSRVLDAGCGTGAFMDVVRPYASELVGLDLSAAVSAAHTNVGSRANVHVAQGDIFRPPVAPASFDFVYCIGVIQHTPDPAEAFASLARLVRPGGRLGVWIYERSPWEALKPRHAMRQYTTRLSEDRAMRFVEGYAPRAVRLRHRLKRAPFGRLWSKAVPVADIHDYAGGLAERLTSEQVAEWMIMDTHDMLVTHHDHPQTAVAVRGWFDRAGFEAVTRADSEQVAMVGRRKG